MKLRNIEVQYKYNEEGMAFATQLFADWYDFADWLKQENLAKHDVVIRSWRYSDKRF